MMASARKRKPTDDGMVHYTGTISWDYAPTEQKT